MFCDLHIHSCNSSGSQTVEEICQEAVKKNISLISITDEAVADLAHELTNPMADLVTLPSQVTYDQNIGLTDQGTRIQAKINFYSLFRLTAPQVREPSRSNQKAPI